MATERPPPRPAFADLDGRAARAAARRLKKGEAPYPRLMVLADCWVRQDAPGGELVVVSATEAERLCGVEAA